MFRNAGLKNIGEAIQRLIDGETFYYKGVPVIIHWGQTPLGDLRITAKTECVRSVHMRVKEWEVPLKDDWGDDIIVRGLVWDGEEVPARKCRCENIFLAFLKSLTGGVSRYSPGVLGKGNATARFFASWWPFK